MCWPSAEWRMRLSCAACSPDFSGDRHSNRNPLSEADPCSDGLRRADAPRFHLTNGPKKRCGSLRHPEYFSRISFLRPYSEAGSCASPGNFVAPTIAEAMIAAWLPIAAANGFLTMIPRPMVDLAGDITRGRIRKPFFSRCSSYFSIRSLLAEKYFLRGASRGRTFCFAGTPSVKGVAGIRV
jgi:hypothetical protein